MASPSFKDVEVLEKLATKLCVPFFALASVLQPPAHITLPHGVVAALAWIVTAPFPMQSDSPTLAVLVTIVCWGLIWAVCCSLFLWILWFIGIAVIGYSWAEWLRPVLLPAAGLAFISMGALALCKIPALQPLAITDPVPSLNVTWEVGFFTFGLWCLQIANTSSDIPHSTSGSAGTEET